MEDDQTIDYLPSSDSTIDLFSTVPPIVSPSNPAPFVNDQPVTTSSSSIGSILSSLGSDALGIVGIEKGTGSVTSNGSTTHYVPTSLGVSSSLMTSAVVIGALAIGAAFLFMHH